MRRFKPAFVVKVCGVTCEGDAIHAAAAGANAIGFNFYPKSPRYLSPERAGELSRALPDEVLRVGIFVNPKAEELSRAAGIAQLDVLQLHGSKRPHTAGYRIWLADNAGSPTPAPNDQVEAYLLDTPSPQFGGSGVQFDWELAAGFPFPMIVAGGLDGRNVAAAIRILKPWGVDACSRLESSPGKKDAARVREFVSAALAAGKSMLPEKAAL